jgi:hypothetical protein
MAWPTIDPTSPAPTDKVKFGDDQIRGIKQAVMDGLSAISNFTVAGTQPALKTTVWATAGRPTDANLIDKVTGFNTDLGYEEYYDLGTTTWKQKGYSLTGAINENKGTDIASATTTDIGAATGNYVSITGTTTITALGTVQAGSRRIVRFTGILTLTYNATSLILPGAANITTAAGDTAEFVSLGSGNWICVAYQRAAGNVPVSGGVTMTGALGILNASASANPVALGQLIGSFGTNGYIKIPVWNGSALVTVILQWGYNASGANVSFPISFPNAALSISTTLLYSTTSYAPTILALTASGFTLGVESGIPTYWMAIGY